jgi:Alpha/beta hydrolase domain
MVQYPLWRVHGRSAASAKACRLTSVAVDAAVRLNLHKSLLQQFYPSHGDYVSQVAQDTQQLVKDGFLLPPDAPEIKVQTAQADVP